jgi:hypothetical protein
MADKLQRIFEYRVLLSNAQERNLGLDPQDQTRLDRLRQQLPMTVPPLDDRDPYTILSEPMPVEFAVGGRFHVGMLRNVSGGGLAIATSDEAPPLGHQLTIHVQDRAHALVYSFPARVVSRVVRGTTGMSVAFDGVPMLTRLTTKSSGVWSAQDAPTEPGPRKQRDSA